MQNLRKKQYETFVSKQKRESSRIDVAPDQHFPRRVPLSALNFALTLALVTGDVQRNCRPDAGSLGGRTLGRWDGSRRGRSSGRCRCRRSSGRRRRSAGATGSKTLPGSRSLERNTRCSVLNWVWSRVGVLHVATSSTPTFSRLNLADTHVSQKHIRGVLQSAGSRSCDSYGGAVLIEFISVTGHGNPCPLLLAFFQCGG